MPAAAVVGGGGAAGRWWAGRRRRCRWSRRHDRRRQRRHAGRRRHDRRRGRNGRRRARRRRRHDGQRWRYAPAPAARSSLAAAARRVRAARRAPAARPDAGGAMGLGGAMMGTGGAPRWGARLDVLGGNAMRVGPSASTASAATTPARANARRATSRPEPARWSTSGPLHGTRPVCGGSGVCGAQCTLTTAVTAACLFAPMTVSCAPQTCRGSTLTLARFCDGFGTCAAAVSGSCPSGLNCNADQTACLASCATNADCNAPAPNCNPATHQCTSGAGQWDRRATSTATARTVCASTSSAAANPAPRSAWPAMSAAIRVSASRFPRASSLTAPAGPCGGAAECQGRCDGTSPACQFPGAETTCVCPGLVPMTGSCNMAGGCLLLGLLCL